jgi:hypothetical protein
MDCQQGINISYFYFLLRHPFTPNLKLLKFPKSFMIKNEKPAKCTELRGF